MASRRSAGAENEVKVAFKWTGAYCISLRSSDRLKASLVRSADATQCASGLEIVLLPKVPRGVMIGGGGGHSARLEWERIMHFNGCVARFLQEEPVR